MPISTAAPTAYTATCAVMAAGMEEENGHSRTSFPPPSHLSSPELRSRNNAQECSHAVREELGLTEILDRDSRMAGDPLDVGRHFPRDNATDHQQQARPEHLSSQTPTNPSETPHQNKRRRPPRSPGAAQPAPLAKRSEPLANAVSRMAEPGAEPLGKARGDAPQGAKPASALALASSNCHDATRCPPFTVMLLVVLVLAGFHWKTH